MTGEHKHVRVLLESQPFSADVWFVRCLVGQFISEIRTLHLLLQAQSTCASHLPHKYPVQGAGPFL